MRLRRGGLNKLTLIILIFASILILTFYFRETNEGILHKTQVFATNSLASIQSGISKTVSPFHNTWKHVTNIGHLSSENERLKDEVVNLKQQIITMQAMEKENERLRKLVGFKEKTHYSTLLARVIGRSSNNLQLTLTINKGSKDGVSKNMPVVVGEGLVGQIIMVSPNAAQVQLITDRRSGVAAQLLNSGETGVVEGQATGRLVMNYVAKNVEVNKNEPILTSGVGSIFPKGLFIGTVSEVKETPYDLYKNIQVKSYVNFSNLEEVFVITDIVPVVPPLLEEGD
ncbi:rod shape-determining protein MreC [Candidatus Oleimmundimicrobium sp.]|uniref:rod shape-determining protein MreC n=1 Tax=Candidatus Oleimmundimicrobium sp. TaxID=3060597 RepID=UPI0027266493|nr:rod shape-determining protein MreC [Candidatus Oleimmundimicrobium sp.]MDO8886139.1 rod shape-determining protein MreC [Candidatus Oleimmundimicrobium sp.]